MLRVLIADDNARVRAGLKEILAEGPGMVVIGQASTGQEALDQARAEAWDVLVLDISLPDQSGLDVLRQLKQERPSLPILLLSMHPGEQYLRGSLKAGAAGFLNKETAPDELRTAIDAVLGGGTYVSPSLPSHSQ